MSQGRIGLLRNLNLVSGAEHLRLEHTIVITYFLGGTRNDFDLAWKGFEDDRHQKRMLYILYMYLYAASLECGGRGGGLGSPLLAVDGVAHGHGLYADVAVADDGRTG